MKKYNIAIVGATGLVGRTFLKILDEYQFPINQLTLYASPKSVGKKILFQNQEYEIKALDENAFENVDIALFSAGAKVSKEFAPLAAEKGAYVIDNSSAWRMDENCALVVPEVNIEDAFTKSAIIANPNGDNEIMRLFSLNPTIDIKNVIKYNIIFSLAINFFSTSFALTFLLSSSYSFWLSLKSFATFWNIPTTSNFLFMH